MAVTKTDWSKPASDPVNRGQSAAAQRYQAMADYYTPNGGTGTVYAGGSPAMRVGGGGTGREATEQIRRELEAQAILDAEARMAAMPARGPAIDPVMANAALAATQLNLSQAPTYGAIAPMLSGVPLSAAAQRYARMPTSGGYPSYLGNVLTEVGALNNRGFAGGLMRNIVDSGRPFDPVFDMSREPGQRLRGMYTTSSFLGVPVTTYTGLDNPDAPQVEERDEVVPTVTDPVTMEQKCPDGYIFDEDLQACRLATTAPVMQPLEPRTPTRTYSLLDQAPTGLLEFQRRYGLPQQQTDFSLLT